MNFRCPVWFALLISILYSTTSQSMSDAAIDYLLKAAPRPAGMGGAFAAVPGDPIGMMWNPAAALRSDRFSISGNHSLRHFPGPRRNLDQLDSDTMGIVVPLQNDDMLGLGFTVPGEWGVDYMDTNEVLPKKERYRGRERRIALADLRGGIRHTSAGNADSNWYRNESPGSAGYARHFQSGGGFSFFYETENGMMYGFNVRGLSHLIKKNNRRHERAAGLKVTLGAAYKADPQADTLAAVDLELTWRKKRLRAKWFAGAERTFDRKYYLRYGSMNGMPTYGAGTRFGSVRLDYAIIKNFLPKITGDNYSPLFQDAHFFSYTLSVN